ncbi:endonuclease III [Myxococcota bacterium]|nr:endonuclease III [Myxococcota bacterium]
MEKNPKKRMTRVLFRLAELYPEVESALVTGNPYQKLVATILSAQCTDARVNLVTPALFARYPDARALARAEVAELEGLIHSTGFYHAKARHLLGASLQLVERHDGEVPADLDALLALPGVARKTANCVLNDCFGVASGIVVDTHVARLALRLGFTVADKGRAGIIERDLMALVPRGQWIVVSHRLIAHGRAVCTARKPACTSCPLSELCPSCGRV